MTTKPTDENEHRLPKSTEIGFTLRGRCITVYGTHYLSCLDLSTGQGGRRIDEETRTR